MSCGAEPVAAKWTVSLNPLGNYLTTSPSGKRLKDKRHEKEEGGGPKTVHIMHRVRWYFPSPHFEASSWRDWQLQSLVASHWSSSKLLSKPVRCYAETCLLARKACRIALCSSFVVQKFPPALIKLA